jgi:NDP-sugar pyrophosphorylase family protein
MISERNFMAFTQDKYFIDIGIPTDYNKAQTDIPRLFN